MSSIDVSDSELVRRTRDGDPESFGVLVTSYLSPGVGGGLGVRAIARRRRGPDELAQV